MDHNQRRNRIIEMSNQATRVMKETGAVSTIVIALYEGADGKSVYAVDGCAGNMPMLPEEVLYYCGEQYEKHAETHYPKTH